MNWFRLKNGYSFLLLGGFPVSWSEIDPSPPNDGIIPWRRCCVYGPWNETNIAPDRVRLESILKPTKDSFVLDTVHAVNAGIHQAP